MLPKCTIKHWIFAEHKDQLINLIVARNVHWSQIYETFIHYTNHTKYQSSAVNFAPKGRPFEINMESLFRRLPLEFPFLEGGPDRLDRAAAFEKLQGTATYPKGEPRGGSTLNSVIINGWGTSPPS